MEKEKTVAEKLSEELIENLRRNVAADKKRRAEAEEDPYQNMHGVCVR